MTTASQLETVRKEIDVVKEKILKTEKALDAAQQAADVDFLRKQLEQLNRQLSSLREKEVILLQGQVSGQHCLPCHHLVGLPANSLSVFNPKPGY